MRNVNKKKTGKRSKAKQSKEINVTFLFFLFIFFFNIWYSVQRFNRICTKWELMLCMGWECSFIIDQFVYEKAKKARKFVNPPAQQNCAYVGCYCIYLFISFLFYSFILYLYEIRFNGENRFPQFTPYKGSKFRKINGKKKIQNLTYKCWMLIERRINTQIQGLVSRSVYVCLCLTLSLALRFSIGKFPFLFKWIYQI